MSKFVRVANLSEIPPGRGISVEVGPRSIALLRSGERVFALDDMCTHSGGPLSEGPIDGECVVCPWHGAAFELATGASRSPIASRGVHSYAVRLVGDDVEIEVDA